jgi:hypothetical protein
LSSQFFNSPQLQREATKIGKQTLAFPLIIGKVLGRKRQPEGIDMATLEKRNDGYRVIFYYRNERFTRSLKTESKQKAEDLQRRLEGNLQLLEQGRLEYAPGKDDLPTVLLTDGKLNSRPEAVKAYQPGEAPQDYRKNLPPDRRKTPPTPSGSTSSTFSACWGDAPRSST